MDYLEVWERLTAASFSLDLAKINLEIELSQVEMFYLPLARRVLELAGVRTRFLVGIAGPPGSGKTVLAEVLSVVLGILSGQQAVVIGMDGWHYSNEYLNTHFVEQQDKHIKLREIKGAPESFDFASFLKCVQAARQGEGFLFPLYNRKLHEPRPRAGRVTKKDPLVIFEGNYLLLDEAPWNQLRSLFDLTLFIQADEAMLESVLLERHQRGGREREDALRHIQEVDVVNSRRILAGFSGAELLVRKPDACSFEVVESRIGRA